jgi:hypothetical protein
MQVTYNDETDTFAGTMVSLVKLAIKAVQEIGWTVTSADENIGLVTFETGVSWSSWSEVSCTLNIEELSAGVFKVTGTGKQNVRRGQLLTINIGHGAQRKAQKAIEMMKKLTSQA